MAASWERRPPQAIVTAAYGLGLLLVNVSVLAWLFIRSPQHRWPVAIILVAQIATRALYVVDTAHLPLAGSLDPDVLGAIIAAVGYSIALFGFRFFDPLPAAARGRPSSRCTTGRWSSIPTGGSSA